MQFERAHRLANREPGGTVDRLHRPTRHGAPRKADGRRRTWSNGVAADAGVHLVAVQQAALFEADLHAGHPSAEVPDREVLRRIQPFNRMAKVVGVRIVDARRHRHAECPTLPMRVKDRLVALERPETLHAAEIVNAVHWSSRLRP